MPKVYQLAMRALNLLYNVENVSRIINESWPNSARITYRTPLNESSQCFQLRDFLLSHLYFWFDDLTLLRLSTICTHRRRVEVRGVRGISLYESNTSRGVHCMCPTVTRSIALIVPVTLPHLAWLLFHPKYSEKFA